MKTFYVPNATIVVAVSIIKEVGSSVRPKRKDFTTSFKTIAIEASLGSVALIKDDRD